MKKKILSMAMAAALVLSVNSVSQAAAINKDTTTGKYAAGEITVTGEYSVPTIDVTLSDSGSSKVVINPYGLTVTSITGVTGDNQKEMLVNKVETITNASDVALAVNATVKATIKGKAKLATAEVKATDTANSIFAYLQMDTGSTITEATTYGAKNPNQVVFAAKETTKKSIGIMKDKNATDKTVAYKIRGNVAPNPTSMWTDEDGVDFSIVFDFEPKLVS